MKQGTVGEGSSCGVMRSDQILHIFLKVEPAGFLVGEKEEAFSIENNHKIFDASSWKDGVSNNRNREEEGKSGVLREEGFRSSSWMC